MKKVGIITWHYFGNFGSALQAFAMQKLLEKINVESEIMNYRGHNFTRRDLLKNKVKEIMNKVPFINNYYPFVDFQKKYLQQSRVLWGRNDLNNYSLKKDVLVCGSDQIWAPNVFDSIYMLDFISNKKVKKISYAASIGLKDIPCSLREKYKELLSDFDFISVREDAGRKLLEDEIGIKADVVLDPTLMIDIKEYKGIERKPNVNIPDNFCFCYFLNEKNSYKEFLRTINIEQMEILGVSRDRNNGEWMTLLNNIGPSEFLWLIDKAKMVVTDSYHGTIFSILYGKDFYTLERFKNDEPENQNSRIFQLKTYFGLSDRIINAEKTVEAIKDIDYANIYRELANLREHSYNFLAESLNGK